MSSDASPMADLDPKALAERITSYLTNGGLFNPEMMPQGPARDLLIDCRDALSALVPTPQVETRKGMSETELESLPAHPLAKWKGGLALGLHRVHWNDGGSSLCSIGMASDGRRWIAPCNWVAPSIDATADFWQNIERTELLFAYPEAATPPPVEAAQEPVACEPMLWFFGVESLTSLLKTGKLELYSDLTLILLDDARSLIEPIWRTMESAPTDGAAKSWPKPGEKMRFLNRGGYDHERAAAAKVMREGEVFTLKTIKIGDWSHTLEFEEIAGRWNGVMFGLAPPLPAEGE